MSPALQYDFATCPGLYQEKADEVDWRWCNGEITHAGFMVKIRDDVETWHLKHLDWVSCSTGHLQHGRNLQQQCRGRRCMLGQAEPLLGTGESEFLPVGWAPDLWTNRSGEAQDLSS